MTDVYSYPNGASPAGTTPPQTASVSLEEVRHVATLANLQLTAEEEPRMQRDLNAILHHIAALNELSTEGVPATAQISELLRHEAAIAGTTLRSDEVQSSASRAAVMEEAPETDGRFFKVPKVIER